MCFVRCKFTIIIVIYGMKPKGIDIPLMKLYLYVQAYKMGFYGPHIIWVLPGWYDTLWFERFPENHDCTTDQLLETIQDSFYLDNSWTNLADQIGFMGHNQVKQIIISETI